jgi:hypothetical protein
MDNDIQPVMSVNRVGNKEWYLHGLHHRMDGPAIESANGNKIWFYRGHRHRIDGPAVEWADGDKYWYLHGKLSSFNEWLEANTELTDEEKVMLKLQYG